MDHKKPDIADKAVRLLTLLLAAVVLVLTIAGFADNAFAQKHHNKKDKKSSSTVGEVTVGEVTVGEVTDSGVISDPLEPVNRVIFKFNEGMDVMFLKPAASFYNHLTPPFLQDMVANFLVNLKSPVTAANQFLQGDNLNGKTEMKRFFINSTLGIGGLFDPAATKWNLHHEEEDFGQTLGKWGAGHGFYLVLPLFGPSSLRDGIGLGVDSIADPLNIYASIEDKEWITYTRGGLEALSQRAGALGQLSGLKKASLDFYASMKSIYEQRRKALIKDGKYNANTYSTFIDYDEDFGDE